MSTPISRRRNSLDPSRPEGRRRGRRLDGRVVEGAVSRSRRLPARSSRCCRRTTRPAISPRSCSGSRCASPSPSDPRKAACVPACPSSPRCTPATKRPKPTLLGALGPASKTRQGAKLERRDRDPRARRTRRRAGGSRRRRRPQFRQAQARRLHLHGVRHVHGDPGHPDRLGLAFADPGRPLGVVGRDHLGPDELSDRRSHHDPAIGIPVARDFDARHLHHLRRRLHADELLVLTATRSTR